MQHSSVLLTVILSLLCFTSAVRLLAFSKTGAFRHDSIPDAAAMFMRFQEEYGWEVVTTENSEIFNDEDLAGFDVVVFMLTTGDILNAENKAAFEKFIKNGGGYLGFHSACYTEESWDWYRKLVGGTFQSTSDVYLTATMTVEDPDQYIMKELPVIWEKVDEWYNFQSNPRENSNIHVLAVVDEKTYVGGNMGEDHPIMWCQEFEGGRSVYMAIGHTAESYTDPDFVGAVTRAVEWITERRSGKCVEAPKAHICVTSVNQTTFTENNESCGIVNGGEMQACNQVLEGASEECRNAVYTWQCSKHCGLCGLGMDFSAPCPETCEEIASNCEESEAILNECGVSCGNTTECMPTMSVDLDKLRELFFVEPSFTSEPSSEETSETTEVSQTRVDSNLIPTTDISGVDSRLANLLFLAIAAFVLNF